jgi:hypothetical protein
MAAIATWGTVATEAGATAMVWTGTVATAAVVGWAMATVGTVIWGANVDTIGMGAAIGCAAYTVQVFWR